ncbi:hypothetical protein DY000_02061953 [Brassica cretica]|uniref:Uncharacterized protein n=1 Tax=Brassica cretica TaxID=69181 RepID=A0ABQ7B0F7_BRACR|nr:hypothetical protein DY000_02061953 [Brassica cretica]
MNRLENSWLALSRSLDSISHGHSAQIVLAQSLGLISRGQFARSPYSAQNDLSQSLRSLSPRGVEVSFCRHPIGESSLDQRVVTRPTSHHSTVLSSLDQ